MTFRVVIDGSTLCKPSDALPWRMEYLELAIRDVSLAANLADSKRNLELKVYIDASTYYKFANESERNRFDELCNEGKIERTPAGGQADTYLLKWAQDHQAIIVANDQYKEYLARFTWIKDQGRSVSAVYDNSFRKWNFMERFAGRNTPRELQEILSSQAQLNNSTTPVATTPVATTPVATTNQPVVSEIKKVSMTSTSGAYQKPVKRDTPAAIVLLVDQSGSMGSIWDGGGSKSVGVAECVNNLLESLVLASIRNRGDVYPYFDVAVLGYGGSGNDTLRSLLPDTTVSDPIRSINIISLHAKVEVSTRNGISEERNIWVKPFHNGPTPMCEALTNATRILTPWVAQHVDSFPPIVMNVTDGISTDGPPQIAARDLLSLRTNDGSVLLLNINIAGPGDQGSTPSAGSNTAPSPKKPPAGTSGLGKKILFPDESVPLPNEAARTLFDMSSVIPEPLRKRAAQLEINLSVGARGFAYNATSSDLTRFFDIGTPQNTI